MGLLNSKNHWEQRSVNSYQGFGNTDGKKELSLYENFSPIPHWELCSD